MWYVVVVLLGPLSLIVYWGTMIDTNSIMDVIINKLLRWWIDCVESSVPHVLILSCYFSIELTAIKSWYSLCNIYVTQICLVSSSCLSELAGMHLWHPGCYCSNYSVVQCLTIFYRSLNEILDLFDLYCKCRVVWILNLNSFLIFESIHFDACIRTPIFAYKYAQLNSLLWRSCW
jgi:hypothetical protein